MLWRDFEMRCTVGSLSAKLIISSQVATNRFSCPAVGSFVSTTSSYHLYTSKDTKKTRNRNKGN
jgi:hypothetical protein